MAILSKYKESVITAGKRILKVVGIGGSVTTAKESYPFGFDSQALAGMTAIYSTTTNDKERVVIGYINKNQLAGVGETRHYAIDDEGKVASYVWCKADGTTEINGNDYSAVRYANLNIQLQDVITQINAQLPLIATGITTGGGSYTPTNITLDLTTAESPTVKIS